MKRNPLALSGGRYLGVGVHDGLSASIASRHAFDFLWLSSFGLSASQGLPDAGLIDAAQLLEAVRVVTRCGTQPLVVDLGPGFADRIKTHHVVRDLATAGVCGVCIEDNLLAKRSSLYNGYVRTLATVEEQADRLSAAQLAVERSGCSCLVIGRTEALVAGEGAEMAFERACSYTAAGADAVFFQSVAPHGAEIVDLCAEWARRTPVFLAPTVFNTVATELLFSSGASHVIYANQALRAAHRAMDSLLSTLGGVAAPSEVEGQLSSVDEVALTVGLRDLQDIEAALPAAVPGGHS